MLNKLNYSDYKILVIIVTLFLQVNLFAGELSNASLTLSNNNAGATSSYTANFRTATQIPAGSFFILQDTHFTVPDKPYSTRVANCSELTIKLNDTNASTLCAEYNTNVAAHTIYFRTSSVVSAGADLNITIPNLVNGNGGVYTISSTGFRTSDGSGITIDSSSVVTFTIVSPNATPVITEGTESNITMSEDGSPTPFSLTLNATDSNSGDTLTWSISSVATHGTASISQTPTGTSQAINYIPTANYFGNDSFIVQVSDGTATDTITVNVNVIAVNDSPSVISIPITTGIEDTYYKYILTANDADGNDLNWSVKSGTTLPSWLALGYLEDFNNTNITLLGDGSPILVDFDNDGDMDIFSFATGDLKYYKNTNGVLELDQTPNVFSMINALSFADIDSDGDMDAIVKGTAIKYYLNDGSGGLTETTLGLLPTQSVIPTFVDIDGDSDMDIVTVTSIYKNLGSGNYSSVSAPWYSIPTFSDIDNDGDMDAIRIVDDGQISLLYYQNDGTGAFTYMTNNPFGSFTSMPTFVDLDKDGDVDAVVKNTTVEYYKNDGSGIFTLSLNQPFTTFIAVPSFGDFDKDGDFDAFGKKTDYQLRYFENISNIQLIGTPTNDDVGVHDVNLTLSDGTNEVEHNFTITVLNTNDIPTSSDLNITINEDTNKTFALNDFNFTDIDSGDSLEAIIISSLPNKGTLQLSDVNVTLNQEINVSDIGSLVYIPVANANGTPYTTFGFVVFDGDANSSVYTATINVTVVDDAPVLQSLSNLTILEDSSDFNITLVSSDVEGDTITYTTTSSNPSIATVSIVDGKVVVTPIGNRYGTVSVEVNATANGKTATQTFTLDIAGVNDTPTFDTNLTSLTINEDSGIRNFEINATDIDGDELNVTITSSDSTILSVTPSWSGLVNQANYRGLDFNLTTQPNKYGNVTITVTAIDTSGLTTSHNFDVNVVSVNDAPVLSPISNVIVYKNSGDKNVTINASDVDGDNLICNAIPLNTQLFSSIDCLYGVVELRIAPNTVGDTDINVTVTDGTLTASKIFNFYILPLEDGTDTAKVNDINVTTENNTTTTSLNIDDNLTITTKKDTNGTVSHEIFVGGKEIKATSEINGSVSEFTSNGVHTTYSDVNKSIEVNATLDGKATHVLTTNGKTTTATSEFVGAQTVIKKDSNNEVEIETSVAIDVNTTIKVTAREDGTAEHSVIKGTKETKATSTIAGATTKITSNGTVETSAGDVPSSESGYTLKAKVVTDENGKTITSFVKLKDSDKTETPLGNTVKSTTPFEAGNNVEIKEISGTLYMKIEAPLSDANLEIE